MRHLALAAVLAVAAVPTHALEYPRATVLAITHTSRSTEAEVAVTNSLRHTLDVVVRCVFSSGDTQYGTPSTLMRSIRPGERAVRFIEVRGRAETVECELTHRTMADAATEAAYQREARQHVADEIDRILQEQRDAQRRHRRAFEAAREAIEAARNE